MFDQCKEDKCWSGFQISHTCSVTTPTSCRSWFLVCGSSSFLVPPLQIRRAQRSVLRLRGGQLSAWRQGIFPPHPRCRRAGEPWSPVGKLFRWGGRCRRQQHEQQQQQQWRPAGHPLACSGPTNQPRTQNHPDRQQPQQRLQGRLKTWSLWKVISGLSKGLGSMEHIWFLVIERISNQENLEAFKKGANLGNAQGLENHFGRYDCRFVVPAAFTVFF